MNYVHHNGSTTSGSSWQKYFSARSRASSYILSTIQADRRESFSRPCRNPGYDGDIPFINDIAQTFRAYETTVSAVGECESRVRQQPQKYSLMICINKYSISRAHFALGGAGMERFPPSRLDHFWITTAVEIKGPI